MSNSKTILFLFFIAIVVSAAVGSAATMAVVTNLDTEDTTNYNLSCPTPDVDVDVDNESICREPVIENTNKVVKTYNNIQATYADTEVTVDESDRVAEISRVDNCLNMQGMSMQPTMFTGNTVCYSLYDSQTLREGQIIIFEDVNDEFDVNRVVHRVKGVYTDAEDPYIATQGDNNVRAEKVEPEDVVGVVKAVAYTERDTE